MRLICRRCCARGLLLHRGRAAAGAQRAGYSQTAIGVPVWCRTAARGPACRAIRCCAIPWSEVRGRSQALRRLTPKDETVHLAYVNPRNRRGVSAGAWLLGDPAAAGRDARPAAALRLRGLHVVEGEIEAEIDGVTLQRARATPLRCRPTPRCASPIDRHAAGFPVSGRRCTDAAQARLLRSAELTYDRPGDLHGTKEPTRCSQRICTPCRGTSSAVPSKLPSRSSWRSAPSSTSRRCSMGARGDPRKSRNRRDAVVALIAFDRSTLGNVLERLEARKLVTRYSSPQDKRIKLLKLTAAGNTLAKRGKPPCCARKNASLRRCGRKTGPS